LRFTSIYLDLLYIDTLTYHINQSSNVPFSYQLMNLILEAADVINLCVNITGSLQVDTFKRTASFRKSSFLHSLANLPSYKAFLCLSLVLIDLACCLLLLLLDFIVLAYNECLLTFIILGF
jgi:hypothetical protein